MTGTAAGAQTVDEIVNRNLEALGGRAALDRVQSLRQTSQLVLTGSESRIVVYAKRPNLIRQELKIAGQTVVQAFDGSIGWTVNRLLGATSPTPLAGADLEALRHQVAWEGALPAARTRGDRIELVGRVTVNGRPAHHLRIAAVDHQRQRHVYVDAETFLEVRTVDVTSAGRFEQDLSSYQTVEGVKIPFSIKTSFNGRPTGEIVVSKVEVNVAIDNAMFTMPAGRGADAK
jgi:hypothetical protein